MRILLGFIIGAAVGGSLGVAAGYNHGREAPIFSNPFVRQDPISRLQRSAEGLLEETRRAVHEATRD